MFTKPVSKLSLAAVESALAFGLQVTTATSLFHRPSYYPIRLPWVEKYEMVYASWSQFERVLPTKNSTYHLNSSWVVIGSAVEAWMTTDMIHQ